MFGFGRQQADGERGVASLGSWIRELGWPRTRGASEWVGVFQGHEIRVVAPTTFRARLFIDGEFRDKRSSLFWLNRGVPLLSGRLPTARTEVTVVYVYQRGWYPMKFEVRVAGRSVPMNPCASETTER